MAKGGSTKLGGIFKGKDTYSEELKEGKAIKSGKISPQEYAKGERMEDKAKNKGGKMMPPAKDMGSLGMKRGGAVKADGKAVRGKTKGRFI